MAGEGYIAPNRSIVIAVGSGRLAMAYGTHTSVAASDTVATGLSRVLAAVAQLEDSPVSGADRALAFIGDQAGTPAAGSILIKTFKPTGAADTTPVAASAFSKKVNWVAFGEV